MTQPRETEVDLDAIEPLTREDEIKNKILEISKSLGSSEWIACPACGEEWTKLRPCRYLVGGKDVMTHVCVTCAESVRSFEKFWQMVPPFSEDSVKIEKYLRSQYRLVPNYVTPKSWMVEIFSNGQNFQIVSDDPRMVVIHKNANSKMTLDNVFQCISYVKKLIVESEKVAETVVESWGRKKTKTSKSD